MKVLIIEDETPAAEKLERYLARYDQDIEVLAILKSVESSVAWLSSSPDLAELIFMDIQLLDGKSFEIFEKTQVDSPIIFTTAYDEYAVEAFKVNSLAYLLKPIIFDDLSQALDKFSNLQKKLGKSSNGDTSDETLQKVLASLNKPAKSYKTRFMVKIGDHIKSIPVPDIKLFFADGRDAYMVTEEGRKFIVDFKLEKLEELLDPQNFMRVNRTFILNINSIKDVIVYSNSRLKVIPDMELDKEIIISREKVPLFKNWIDGKVSE